jgi:hypothetical protein
MTIMLAPCGFRCDLCVAFKDNATHHADRVRGSGAWAKYYGLQVPPQQIQCHGCATGRVAGLRWPDQRCRIRPCASKHGVATCAQCDEYVCDLLESRMTGCDEVVRRFRGAIAERDFARFIAPYDRRANLEELRKKGPPGRDSKSERGR